MKPDWWGDPWVVRNQLQFAEKVLPVMGTVLDSLENMLLRNPGGTLQEQVETLRKDYKETEEAVEALRDRLAELESSNA